MKPATPLPWTKGPHRDAHVYGPSMCNIYTLKDNLPPLAEKVTYTDAAYIVAACNAYPELVDALRKAIADADAWCQDEHNGPTPNLDAERALLKRLETP